MTTSSSELIINPDDQSERRNQSERREEEYWHWRTKIDQCSPYSSVISAETKDNYVRQLMAFDPDRIEFHIRRLRNPFTGTRVGVLVQEANNKKDPLMRSANSIAREILLQKLPDPVNGDMKRGVLMEPLIRQDFHDKKWCSSLGIRPEDVRFVEQIPHLTMEIDSWHGVPLDATLRFSGHPDDLLIIGELVYVVDYKSQARSEDLSISITDDIMDAYRDQMTLYGMMLQQHGYNLGGCILAPFNYKTFSCAPRLMNMDQIEARQDALISACAQLHKQFLSKGNIPPFLPKTTRTYLDEEQVPGIQSLMDQLTLSKAHGAQWAELEDELKQQISASCNNHPIGAFTHDTGIMTMTIKEQINEESLSELLANEHLSMPVREVPTVLFDRTAAKKIMMDIIDHSFESISESTLRELFSRTGHAVPQLEGIVLTPDLDAASRALEAIGLDKAQWTQSKISFSVPRGKNDSALVYSALREDIKADIEAMIDNSCDIVADVHERVLNIPVTRHNTLTTKEETKKTTKKPK